MTLRREKLRTTIKGESKYRCQYYAFMLKFRHAIYLHTLMKEGGRNGVESLKLDRIQVKAIL